MSSLLICLSMVVGQTDATVQVLAEVGRDSRQTRLYSVCTADLRGDGTRQIVVGGFNDSGDGEMSDVTVYTMGDNVANVQSRVMWKGSSNSVIKTVRSGDLDGDGRDEIVVVGRIGGHINHRYPDDQDDADAQLKVFGLRDGMFRVLAAAQWQNGVYSHGYGLELSQLDGDGPLEIISGGFFNNGQLEKAEIRVWRFSEGALHLVDQAHWGEKGKTRVNAIAVGDVDKDGLADIITAGRTGQIENGDDVTLGEQAQLTAWRFSDGRLTHRASYEWDQSGFGRLRAVNLADVDGDGAVEVITVGQWDGTQRPYAGVFRCTSQGFEPESEATWPADRLGEVRGVTVYGEGADYRIVTIGSLGVKPDRQGQMQVWRLSGSRLEMVQDRRIALGDETRVRDLLQWPSGPQTDLVTVGFRRNGKRCIGQILSWGALP